VWLNGGVPMLPALNHLEQVSTLGFYNGVVYDVLSDNQGNGDVWVNATSFNVSCGQFPNSTAREFYNQTGTWSIDSSYESYQFATNFSVLREPLNIYMFKAAMVAHLADNTGTPAPNTLGITMVWSIDPSPQNVLVMPSIHRQPFLH
jgi:hypothetical protein